MQIRQGFLQEMKLLHLDLIKMGSLAEESIMKSVLALQSRDAHLAEAVVRGDDRIDDLEKNIESRCLSLILRQQPIAGDLRKISTALKMVTDLERIGDNAADIAQISLSLRGEPLMELFQHIPPMAEAAVEMVRKSIDAFIAGDLSLAEKIILDDDIVDDLFCCVKNDLAETLKKDQDRDNNSIDYLMIAKYLERIADHAVNICEWVIFSETGIHKNKRIL